MTLLQNYAGSKPKSSEFTKLQMFATWDKTKPCTESIRGLNLVAVRLTTFRVKKLSLGYRIEKI